VLWCGDFTALVEADYCGIALNAWFIVLAQRRYVGAAPKRFQVEDATKMRFPARLFDTTLFNNGMRHFSTERVGGIVREIVHVTQTLFVCRPKRPAADETKQD
jgi:hypothetical protein